MTVKTEMNGSECMKCTHRKIARQLRYEAPVSKESEGGWRGISARSFPWEKFARSCQQIDVGVKGKIWGEVI